MDDFQRLAHEMQQDKNEKASLERALNDKNDFIVWLFEDSGLLDNHDLSEEWERFDKWNQGEQGRKEGKE